MKYNFLLFDVDDTLLDFKANEKNSLNMLFKTQGVELTSEILDTYNKINKGLWHNYEKGNLTLDYILNTRFSSTLEKHGIKVDGVEWERVYHSFLGDDATVIDGALEACRYLSLNYSLYAITNGISDTQKKRLKNSGLYDFFINIFDSQSIGVQKPDKGFFEYVIKNIDGFDKRKTLIIGDSPNTDIYGGMIMGIDTCWLNRDSSVKCDFKYTYRITGLNELYNFL